MEAVNNDNEKNNTSDQSEKQKSAWIKEKFNPDPIQIQRKQLEQLLKNPNKPVKIPKGSAQKRTVSPPPEIVSNVPGSSAGAGSGEFYVYKKARRKEYERLKIFEEEAKEEEEQKEFEKQKWKNEKRDAEKLNKNRLKRLKRKQSKKKSASNDSNDDQKIQEQETFQAIGHGDTTQSTSLPKLPEKPGTGTLAHGHVQPLQEITKPLEVIEPKGLVIVDDDEEGDF